MQQTPDRRRLEIKHSLHFQYTPGRLQEGLHVLGLGHLPGLLRGLNLVLFGIHPLLAVHGRLRVRDRRKNRLRQNGQHGVQRRAHALLRDHGVRNGKRRDAQRHQRPGRRHLLLHPRRGGERARRGHDQGRKHEGGRRYAGASGHHIDRGSNGIDGVQDVGRGLRQRRHRSERRDVRFIHDDLCASLRSDVRGDHKRRRRVRRRVVHGVQGVRQQQIWRHEPKRRDLLQESRQLCRRVVVDVLFLMPRDVLSKPTKKWYGCIMLGQ